MYLRRRAIDIRYYIIKYDGKQTMLLNIPQPNILLVVSFNFSPCSQTSLVSPLLGGGGCGVTRARQVPRQLPVTTSGSAPTPP